MKTFYISDQDGVDISRANACIGYEHTENIVAELVQTIAEALKKHFIKQDLHHAAERGIT